MPLRILSVVTLVSPLGEYGGPLRVAVNQATALKELGHDVVIAGGVRGYEHEAPTSLGQVPAVLFPVTQLLPGTGFAGLAAPGLWRWFARHCGEFDVVHIHAARDLVTLPVARLAALKKVPYVLQTHGMIDPSSNPLARPLDALLTRPVLRRARSALHLTDVEAAGLVAVGGDRLRLVQLPNGVPLQDAGAAQVTVQVLYLARLAPRKRPLYFVEAAVQLSRRYPGTEFLMIGPDEGEGPAVREAIAAAAATGVSISWAGGVAPEETVQHMRRASIYVLPSVDEPYPMSVLEAMSLGLPVVVTDSCGLAGAIERTGAGLVVDDSLDALVSSVARMLDDAELRTAMGRSGRTHVREQLSMTSIARQLEALYSH